MIKYTSRRCAAYGGIAQLARAIGSYPIGHGFKSSFRYHFRPVGQAVKTRPFHGCNMGSIPVRVTKIKIGVQKHSYFYFAMRTHRRTHHRACAGLGSQIQRKDVLCSHNNSSVNLVPRAMARRHLPVRNDTTHQKVSCFFCFPCTRNLTHLALARIMGTLCPRANVAKSMLALI